MKNDIQIIIGLLSFLVILTLVNLLITYLFKNDRVKFLTALLSVTLIVSNIILAKTTVIFGLTLPCSIIIYPLTFLFTISITHLSGVKGAIKSVFFAMLIQLIISLVFYYTLVILPDQLDTIVAANQLRNIIGSSIKDILNLLLPSLLTFGVSQFLAIGIYSILSKYTYKIISAMIALLIPVLIDSCMFTIFTMMGKENMLFMMSSRFVANVAYTLLMIIMFMIFTIKTKKKD